MRGLVTEESIFDSAEYKKYFDKEARNYAENMASIVRSLIYRLAQYGSEDIKKRFYEQEHHAG